MLDDRSQHVGMHLALALFGDVTDGRDDVTPLVDLQVGQRDLGRESRAVAALPLQLAGPLAHRARPLGRVELGAQ